MHFRARLRAFIKMKLDLQYRDQNNIYFITSSHDNVIINYVNITAKWYISKKFQSGQATVWDGFKRIV